ncbi:MAG: glycosyltransferase family 4 protein, partial [Terrimicrobiaceae bacterium]|nr:glycosyltransferase family 4 protein [Terrimicrobiaceae bacterium]
VFLPPGPLGALREAKRVAGSRPDVFLVVGMRHLSPLLAMALRPGRSLYYHITHELTPGIRRQLAVYAAVFHRLVFLSPETWRQWGGGDGTAWALQPTEIAGALPRVSGDWEGRALRLGFLGRLTAAKGLGMLLETLADGLPGCELHVAGRGELKERVRAAGRPVVFHGAFSTGGRAQFLREFFGKVDLLCVPTLDEREGMPNVILEALQFGVPSLATAAGGMRALLLPELGPAPPDVIRLVAPADYPRVLREMTAKTFLMASPESCRAYFDRFFSDAVLRPRWRELLG